MRPELGGGQRSIRLQIIPKETRAGGPSDMALMPLPRLWLEDYASPKIFFYSAGTTSKIDAYTTSALSVALANPLSADANGLFAAIYFDPALSYKVVVAPSTDSDPPTNAIYEQDNMTASAAEA